MTRLPTFSALPRWFACQLCDVLPQADEPNEHSEAGSARHRFLQRVTEILGAGTGLAEARDLALDEAEEIYREALAAIPVEALGLENVAAEVALAIDLDTGEARELGRGLERDYSDRRPSEIVGTIDQLGFIGDDGLAVRDFKGRSHRTAPEKDPQFLAATLAASRVYRRGWAEITVIPLVDGEAYPRKGRVDFLDLDAFELRLQDRRALAEKNDAAFKADGTLPPATVAEHCRYCPSMRFCPAKMSLARAVLGGTDEEIKGIVAAGAQFITDESAPRLKDLVSQAEKVLEVVKEALKDYARQHPFSLGDGRLYGVNPEATEREIVNGKSALTALAEILGPAAQEAANVEVTFSGIERAIKVHLGDRIKRGDLKEWKERAEGLLMERGFLRVTKGGVVKAFKPKGAKEAA